MPAPRRPDHADISASSSSSDPLPAKDPLQQYKEENLPRLTRETYDPWMSRVKDFLFGLDWPEIANKARVVDGEEQTGMVPGVPPPLRRHIWVTLRKSLSDADLAKFDVPEGDCEQLLRTIRLSFYNKENSTLSVLIADLGELHLSKYSNVNDYIRAGLFLFSQLKDIGNPFAEQTQVHYLLQGLPSPDYAQFKSTMQMFKIRTVDPLVEALRQFAIDEPLVLGSLHPKAIRDKVNATKDTRNKHKKTQLCIKHSEGKCRQGNDCKYKHVDPPLSKDNRPRANSNSGTGKFIPPSRKICTHCDRTGHLADACYLLHPSLAPKCTYCDKSGHLESACYLKHPRTQKQDSSNVVRSRRNSPESSRASSRRSSPEPRRRPPSHERRQRSSSVDRHSRSPGQRGHHRRSRSTEEVTERKYASDGGKFDEYQDYIEACHAVSSRPTKRSLVLLLDGGSTCTILSSTEGCVNVRQCDYAIRTGGGVVTCTTEADFHGETIVGGRLVPIRIPNVRILPNFSGNNTQLLSESALLKGGGTITKTESKVTIKKKGVTILEAYRDSHDGLFYVTLSYSNFIKARDCAYYTSDVDLAQYCTVQAEDLEDCNWCGQTDKAYVTEVYSESSELKLLHERLGHRNLVDVARVTGTKLPRKPVFCKSCVEGKSTRHSFNHRRLEPFYDAPRPGYCWHVDMAGPFSVPTHEGEKYLLVLVDGYSRRIYHALRKTTADFDVDWEQHCAKVEAELGRPRAVANLVSDSAAYFDSKRLQAFNLKSGIVHLSSPPYTQELNHLAERSIRTILEMARCMMIHSGAPKHLHGDACTYAIFLLNLLPWRKGEDRSRLDMYYDRSSITTLKRARVFGCAVWIHQVHPTGRHVDKLDPRSLPYFLVGYSSSRQSYMCRRLIDFKLTYSAHCTFNETEFPCKSLPHYVGSNFADTSVNARFTLHGLKHHPALPTKRPRSVNTTHADAPLSKRQKRLRQEPSSLPLSSIPTPVYSKSISTAASDRSLENNPDLRLTELADIQIRTLVDDLESQHRELVAMVIDAPSICHVLSEVAAASSGVPTSLKKALCGPESDEWLVSLRSELASHKKYGTLGPPLHQADFPPGIRPVPVGPVLKVKRGGRKKVRLVVKGYHLVEGRDFNETYASVPDVTIIKTLLAVAAIHDWEIDSSDVVTAFLQSEVDHPIFVQIPDFYLNPVADYNPKKFTFHLMKKAIPGIPQAPRLFASKVKSIVSGKAGLLQCPHCPSLFVCTTRRLYLVHWVDDFYLFYPTSSSGFASQFWKTLRTELDMDTPAPVTDMLGCVITRDRPGRSLKISQSKAITALRNKIGFDNCSWVPTPMRPDFVATKTDCPTDTDKDLADRQTEYRSYLMSLVWFSRWTIPQICYAVSKLGKFIANPGEKHFIALKRLLRYVFTHASVGITYPAQQTSKPGVYGYWDSSHADDIDTRRSTFGQVFYYAGCPISWVSRLNTYVTTSTNHSEYCALARAAREAKYLKSIFGFLGRPQDASPVELFGDNAGAVSLSNNVVDQTKNKHIDLADHYTRELINDGTIVTTRVSAKLMVADIFTKPLGPEPFLKFTKQLTGCTSDNGSRLGI